MSKKKIINPINPTGGSQGGGNSEGQGGTSTVVPPGFQIPDLGGTETPDIFPNSLTGPGTRGSAVSKFVPIDINALENLATQMDAKGYGLSDSKFAQLYPDLHTAAQYMPGNAALNIKGDQEDPMLSGALNTAGLGDMKFTGDPYEKARNLGVNIMSVASRNRNFFTALNGTPYYFMRNFGLNSNNVAQVALANTAANNAFNNAKFGSNLNQYQSSVQQSIQNNAALIGGAGKLAGGVLNNPAVDNYLFPSSYNNLGAGSAAANDYAARGLGTGGETDTSAASSGGI